MVFKRILAALERLEEGQRAILERLETARTGERTGDSPDKWLQEGIDNILAYQAGRGKEEQR